jgi:CheY-like chemotaxis protein
LAQERNARSSFNSEGPAWAAGTTAESSTSEYLVPKSGTKSSSQPRGPEARGPRRKEQSRPADFRILVADDEPELLEIFRKYLTESGFSVFTAEDGSEAVARFIEARPEVSILDYRMPRSDGLEAAQEILSMKSSAKIIMLTADGTVLEEAERIGIELFLEKPVKLSQLLDSVNTLIGLKSSTAIISR